MVVDASSAVAWYLDPQNVTASAILSSLVKNDALVPGNFQTEVMNALLKAERRGLCDESHVALAIEDLRALPLEVKMPSLSVLAALARRYTLTAYDAAYLSLALEHSTQLATLDAKLAAAAKSENALWSARKRTGPR